MENRSFLAVLCGFLILHCKFKDELPIFKGITIKNHLSVAFYFQTELFDDYFL